MFQISRRWMLCHRRGWNKLSCIPSFVGSVVSRPAVCGGAVVCQLQKNVAYTTSQWALKMWRMSVCSISFWRHTIAHNRFACQCNSPNTHTIHQHDLHGFCQQSLTKQGHWSDWEMVSRHSLPVHYPASSSSVIHTSCSSSRYYYM